MEKLLPSILASGAGFNPNVGSNVEWRRITPAR
jgi:hypothetical protein